MPSLFRCLVKNTSRTDTISGVLCALSGLKQKIHPLFKHILFTEWNSHCSGPSRLGNAMINWHRLAWIAWSTSCSIATSQVIQLSIFSRNLCWVVFRLVGLGIGIGQQLPFPYQVHCHSQLKHYCHRGIQPFKFVS